MKNREHKRFDIRSHCDIECAIAKSVRIKNISMGGLCLETSRYIDTRGTYEMKIVTKRNEEAVLKGVIVWSSLREAFREEENIHPVYDIGIRFIDQTAENKTFLEHLIRRRPD